MRRGGLKRERSNETKYRELGNEDVGFCEWWEKVQNSVEQMGGENA